VWTDKELYIGQHNAAVICILCYKCTYTYPDGVIYTHETMFIMGLYTDRNRGFRDRVETIGMCHIRLTQTADQRHIPQAFTRPIK
jgi:hypothetical protein